MADLTYDIQVKTSDAERNLNKLQNSVTGINSSFIKLRETIATITLGATIQSALALADGIQDLSDATGIATANILGFSKAVSASGGNSESAQKGLLRLVNTIGEAADGSKEAQRAFSEVGISLNDLATMSEQDILAKTIQGLSKVDDVAKRSTLTTKLLGKEFRGVSLTGVAGDYDAAVAASQKYSAAIKSAAETQDKLDATIKNFQLALLNSIKPLTEFLNKLDPDAIQIFIDRIIKIGSALGGLFIIGKVVSMIEGYIIASRAAAAASLSMAAANGNMFASFALGLKQVGQAFSISTAATVATYTGFSTLGIMLKSLTTGFLRMLPVIGIAVVAFQLLDGAVETLTGKDLSGWLDSAAAGFERWTATNFPALAAGINKLGDALGMGTAPSVKAENDAELKRIQARAKAAKDAADAAKKNQEKLRQIQTDLAKNGLELRQQTDDYEEQLRFQQQRMANETKLIFDGKELTNISADQLEIEKAKLDLLYGQRSLIQGYQKQIEKIKLDQALGVGDAPEVSAAKIKQLQDAILRVQRATGGAEEGLVKYITQQQTARLLEEDRKRTLENITKAIEDQIARQQALSDILTGANRQAAEARDIVPPGQRAGLNSLQKQILDIQENSRKAAQEAARSFADAFGSIETPELAQEFSDGLDKIAQAYKRVADAQTETAKNTYEVQRSFEYGWKEAFVNYTENAMNAADQAKTYFDSFAKGFEDAIVALVTNGKWSFKDFANSIIADFARIQARKMLTGLMGGEGGGGIMSSLFSWGKSLLGFANGGGVMSNNPIIVGERGPELFIPKSAGQIIPNNQLGGSREKPQPVTVNYNINAVDAASFRSLVARDPGFIYAVTEQGRRSQPTRRVA